MSPSDSTSADTTWWEVSFDVPAASSDDLAALLFEFDALGTEIHSAGFPLPRLPDAQGNPPIEAKAELPEGHDRIIACFDPNHSEEDLLDSVREAFMALSLSAPNQVTAQFREDASWRESWKAFFKPLQLSPSVWVRPTWEDFSSPDHAHVLVLDPGFAFGTGQHPTTALCVAALEALMSPAPEKLLDVGCGSGILSLAALALGTQRAVGVDVDPHSVRATQENARLNGWGESLDVPDCSLEEVQETFPLVVANILAVILIEIAPAVLARVNSGGTLLLSGILDSQRDDVHNAYQDAAARLGRPPLPTPTITQREDWITMTYQLSGVSP